MKLKFLSALLLIVLCFSLCPAYAIDEETDIDTSEIVVTDTESETESQQTTTTTTTTISTTSSTSTSKITTTTPKKTTTTPKKKYTTTKKRTQAVLAQTNSTSESTSTTSSSLTTTSTTPIETIPDETFVDFAFVTAEQLNLAASTKQDLEITTKIGTEHECKWLIKAVTIMNPTTVELAITKDSADLAKIKSILPEGSVYSVFDFNHNGNFPFTADLSINNVDVPDGTYYLYYFNKATASGVYCQDVNVAAGVLNLNISAGYNYFIIDQKLPVKQDTGLDSYTKLLINVAIAILIAAFLGYIVSKIRGKIADKKNTEFNEQQGNEFVKISDEDDFIVTTDFDDLIYDDEVTQDFILTDEVDAEIDKIMYELDFDDDILTFEDIKEDSYSYISDFDEIVLGVENDNDTSYDNSYVDQTNSEGIIMETDDRSQFVYDDYNENYGIEADPMYGLVFSDEEFDEEDNLTRPIFDDDLLLENDDEYDMDLIENQQEKKTKKKDKK